MRVKPQIVPSMNRNHIVDAVIGEQVGLVLEVRGDRKPHHVVLEVVAMSFGLGPGVKIVDSDSDRFPKWEGWSLPIATLHAGRLPAQLADNETYLKQVRLWEALRWVLRKELAERALARKATTSRALPVFPDDLDTFTVVDHAEVDILLP